jgi:UDP-N-acetyl-D-mannosaminuronate dehydrogenase
MTTVVVAGPGYVGLPLAIRAAPAGRQVISENVGTL